MTFGISYQSVTRDLTKVNMASGRINTNEDRKTYRRMQKWFAKEVCQPDWEEFVFRMFLEGKIAGYSLADYMKDPWYYNQVQWMPPGFDYIDPSREATAAIDLNQAKMRTLESHYSEQGLEWRDQVDQTAVEQAYMKEKGVEIPIPKATGQGAMVNGNDREEEEE
jgi:capsid protein